MPLPLLPTTVLPLYLTENRYSTIVVMSLPQLPNSQSPQDCQKVSEGLLSVVCEIGCL